jgi:chaperonin GroES
VPYGIVQIFLLNTKEKNAMKLKPLHDRVVVQILEAESRTASGIVIPDAAQEKPNRGRVLSVGAGRRLENGTVLAMAVTVGDEVLFGKYAGQVVKVDGEEITVLKEEDIFAVVEQ